MESFQKRLVRLGTLAELWIGGIDKLKVVDFLRLFYFRDDERSSGEAPD